jgi:hypothetical protein
VLPALAGASNRNGSKVWTLRARPEGHGVKSHLPVDNSSKFYKFFRGFGNLQKFCDGASGFYKNFARGPREAGKATIFIFTCQCPATARPRHPRQR